MIAGKYKEQVLISNGFKPDPHSSSSSLNMLGNIVVAMRGDTAMFPSIFQIPFVPTAIIILYYPPTVECVHCVNNAFCDISI